MSNSIYSLLLLIVISSGTSSYAQDEIQLKDLVERLAENGDEEEDLSALSDQLRFLKRHPINLNDTNPTALKQLIFLSSLQISNFFEYLASNGKLLDLLELQSIDSFDAETINSILPYVSLEPINGFSTLSLKNLYQHADQQLTLRYGRLIETQKGFKPLPGSRYLGTPDKLLLRYKYQYSDFISAGLVLEKDAGERFLAKKAPIDFLSGTIAISKLNRIKKLVIGDYSLQFGQGLTLWSGFSFGKGPDVTSVAAKDVGLRPYTSANEASFFRGIGSTIKLSDRLELTGFASYRKLDASLKTQAAGETQTAGNTTLTTIGISGLHRSQTEINNKKALLQQVYGGTLQYMSNNLSMGMIAYHSAYNHEFITGTQLYKRYSFEGRRLSNAGFHYNYTFQSAYFYGEVAHSFRGGNAFLQGVMTNISSKLSAVLVYRKYDKDHHNFFSQAIAENTQTSNEEGWYTGFNYMPSKLWKIAVYLDKFKFPWLKYRVDSASAGHEILMQAVYAPNKTTKLSARFKTELKQQNPDAGSQNISIEKVFKTSYRVEYNWKAGKRYSFQHRAEIARYRKGSNHGEYGYMLLQDFDYTPPSSKLSGNLRLAWFHTPSYNSRIYAYEDDVLQSSSSGNYYGKGIRTYINTRYRWLKTLDLSTKYAIYKYKDQTSIGSGLDEIKGNTKSDFKIQLRYQF